MTLEPHLDPCTHCGACLSFCAWDAAERAGQPAGPALCRDCQLCYRICPRLPHSRAELAEVLFPGVPAAPWGPTLAAHTARACVRPGGAQDGGVTTRLLQHLLATGQVEAALVCGRNAAWQPEARWASSAADVEAAGGSKYSTAPGLAALREGLERFRRVALVALPCQCAALARSRAVRPEWHEAIALVIGLFCTESFVHGQGSTGLTGLVEERLGRPLNEVQRFDIKRGRFTAQAGEACAEWRMKELHDIVWPLCRSCVDLTAEFADLSIGSIGSPEAANTVIARSPRGLAALQAGADSALWTLEALDKPEALAKQCERKRGVPLQLSPAEQALYGRRTVRGNWKRRPDG
jgi:coenzyme F420-reducing hydrogenase beta subunit